VEYRSNGTPQWCGTGEAKQQDCWSFGSDSWSAHPTECWITLPNEHQPPGLRLPVCRQPARVGAGPQPIPCVVVAVPADFVAAGSHLAIGQRPDQVACRVVDLETDVARCG
jgi:hypothetical protein